jgi:hypothetical protein
LLHINMSPSTEVVLGQQAEGFLHSQPRLLLVLVLTKTEDA